jgi:DNA-binding response OmpR family regulator
MSTARRNLGVEDEPLLAMMLEDFLDMLGHEVAGAADCVDGALAAIDAGQPDDAILDVNLRGGETCWPVADRLVERDVPFVLATGGSGNSIVERYRDRPTLDKPFTMVGVKRVLATLD